MEDVIDRLNWEGRLFVWTFRPDHPSYRGWNLSADVDGCLAMVRILEEMQEAAALANKKIQTVQGDTKRIKSLTGSKPVRWAETLTLEYRRGEERLWVTEEKEGILTITCGDREIDLLQTAFFRIMKGESNFALGDEKDGHLVYFWSLDSGSE